MDKQKPLQKQIVKTTENEPPANTNIVPLFWSGTKQRQEESWMWADVKVQERFDHSRPRRRERLYLYIYFTIDH